MNYVVVRGITLLFLE